MKILHTADIHLREYEDNRWKALQKLIEIGKKKKIEIFIVSGDLFDKDVNAEALRPKIREVFSNNGFKIMLIPGNHDSDSYTSGKYFGGDVVVLTDLNKPFEYKDVVIWGLPFEPIEGEKILDKLRSLSNNLSRNKKNILLYHGELLDAFFSRKDFGDEGEERYMPVKLSYFKDLDLDYVLAGHFHSKFEVWNLKNGGYFVYPGSPISITKRETGQRKVNIFEVGEPPGEYSLDTPYFEEVVVEFNPFSSKNPIEVIKEELKRVPPEANIILTIKGYINCEEIKVSETKVIKQIEEIIKDRCNKEDFKPEFKDIHTILEDDLFKIFVKKLEKKGYDKARKKQLLDVAIKAMMEAGL